MGAARRLIRVLLPGVALVWLVGCNLLTDSQEHPDTAATDWEAATDLNSEYGGYSFVDEEPAFGDPDVAKIDGEENLVPLETEAPEMQRARFAVRILWGQLRGNPAMMQGTDWSGGMAVSSGAMAVLHTIGFEMRDVVLPRENRQQLRFTSHTRNHFDGLLLAILEDSDPEATFSFRTGPYQHQWRLAELRDIDVVIPVDEVGNAISLQSIPLEPECPQGFLRGHWVRRDTEERGIFRGMWVTSFGRPLGHVRGHFGINDAGQQVWFGKIIDRQGRVIGLARGQWMAGEDPTIPGGVFQGHWAGREGAVQGRLRGRYLSTRESERGVAGFFAGRWGSECETPAEPTSP